MVRHGHVGRESLEVFAAGRAVDVSRGRLGWNTNLGMAVVVVFMFVIMIMIVDFVIEHKTHRSGSSPIRRRIRLILM